MCVYTVCVLVFLLLSMQGLVGVVNLRVRTGPGYLDIPNKLKRSLSVKGTSIQTTIRKGVNHIAKPATGNSHTKAKQMVM